MEEVLAVLRAGVTGVNATSSATHDPLRALCPDTSAAFDPLWHTLVVNPFCGGFLVYWASVGFWFLCDLFVDPKHRVPGKIPSSLLL